MMDNKKLFYKTNVAGFFNDGIKRFVLCNILGQMFVVEDGVNGRVKVWSVSANDDHFEIHGFAVIELELHGGKYRLKPLEATLRDCPVFRFMSPHIIVGKDDPDVISESEMRELFEPMEKAKIYFADF